MDVGYEFEKIKYAFEKVKEDLNTLRKELINVKRENRSLREELDKVSNRKPVTKTVTKTVVKKTVSSKDKIIGNSDSLKVHYLSCAYAKKINKDNKVEFKTLKDALKQGYNRCSCIFNN